MTLQQLIDGKKLPTALVYKQLQSRRQCVLQVEYESRHVQ